MSSKFMDLLLPIGVLSLSVASFAMGSQVKTLERRVEGLEGAMQAAPMRANERGSYGKASR